MVYMVAAYEHGLARKCVVLLRLRAPAAIAVQDVLCVEQLLQIALVRIRPDDDGVWVELAHDALEAELHLLVAVGTRRRATAAATGHLRRGAHCSSTANGVLTQRA